MRLLVVRDEASAVVDRFALIRGGREAVVVPSIEQAPTGGGFDAALVDVGSAREGLEVARRLRDRDLDCPAVVIGAEEPTGADLPDGVWLLLRPFTLADLDSRLRELTDAARRQEAATREAEEPEPGLLARLLGRRSDSVEMDVSAEAREYAPEEPQADVPAEHREDASEVPDGDEPRVYRRLRGTPDPGAVTDEIVEVRRATERLLGLLRRHPNLADRHRFGQQVLQEADARVVVERISMWAPLGDGYELLAAAGPEPPPRSAEVAEGQPLVSEIRARSDAVLLTGVTGGVGPLEGIPGARGPTVVAVALREGADLVGVLIADGDDLRLDDRDRLTALAERAGPQLRLAGLIETLRTDQLIVLPEQERAEGRSRH